MDQTPQFRPLYHPDVCRYCEEELHPDDKTQGRVMHPGCETVWLNLKPFIPCKFCENPLDQDDINDRRSIHLDCEFKLSTSPIPSWP